MAGSCVVHLQQTISVQTSLRAPVSAVAEDALGACVGSVSVNFGFGCSISKRAHGMQLLVGWRGGRGCRVPRALHCSTKCTFCLCVKGENYFSPPGLPPDAGRKIFPSREMPLCC